MLDNGMLSNKNLRLDDRNFDNAKFPGPMLRAMIGNVEETGTSTVITNNYHGTFDALAMGLFFDDLDRALSEMNLQPHVEYKLRAKMFYSMLSLM
jgi:hypothetical protein